MPDTVTLSLVVTKNPQLVFDISAQHFLTLKVAMDEWSKKLEEQACSYFGFKIVFHSGETFFGYNKCGRFKHNNNRATVSVDLRGRGDCRYAAFTLMVLCYSDVFAVCDSEERSMAHKYVSLDITCHNTPSGHGFSGYVFPKLGKWLQNTSAGEQLGPSVLAIKAAMEQTWKAIAPTDLKHRYDNCFVQITEDGRFILGCFGNACDAAIYPDQFSGGWEITRIQFGSHNVDSATQQLTLLAGIAKMVSLATTVKQ